MEQLSGERVAIRWRSFPLEQVNHHHDREHFWMCATDKVLSLRALLAVEAVRDQIDGGVSDFVFGMLSAVHHQRLPVQSMDTIVDVARQIQGLDVQALLEDMDSTEHRERIASDYNEAVNAHGIFGTPTIHFVGGEPVFIKMIPPNDENEALVLWNEVRTLSLHRPYVQELKKPRRPVQSDG